MSAKGNTVVKVNGRPTKYKPEYDALLVEFFNRPATRREIETYTTKNGTTIEKPFDAPEQPPFVVDFCDLLSIDVSTFYYWIDKQPSFSKAYAHAKMYLERNVVANGLLNNYNAGFASLVAKNWLGWTDKQDVTSGGERIEPLQIYLPTKLTERQLIDGEVIDQPKLDSESSSSV